MSKKQIVLDVAEDLVLDIQALQYECDARAELCSFMIRQGVINKEDFNDYHKEYVEYHTKYELLKRKLEDEVIKPQIDFDNFNWNLDFTTNKVTIDEL